MIEAGLAKIIIVGGGTAGWMTAAALSRFVNPRDTKICLVESSQIGTVGVGEATLPHLRFFNQTLGIDEKEFMRETDATFKLGIEFSNWGKNGQTYIHPFGDYGKPINDIAFHHFWLKYSKSNPTSSIGDYSFAVRLAQKQKFAFPSNDHKSINSSFSYAYHIDAGKYANFLRKYSESKGVIRYEAIIDGCEMDQQGNIARLCLQGGDKLEADFFIDCSGFRSLLIGKQLEQPFQSWKHWLPCDRAIAIPTKSNNQALPYTKAIAHQAGWRWKIPLQHRQGNGIVYASEFMSQNQADNILDKALGEQQGHRNKLFFEAGTRQQHWVKNCVAIGLSSGFLEPLESTSIYLIQSAIMKLVEYLPGCTDYQLLRDEFNRQMETEIVRIRDFLILHYHITAREDSEFWRHCKNMLIPDSLAEKIELFKLTGHVESYEYGLFLAPSWIAVYLGQGAKPQSINRIADTIDKQKLTHYFQQLKASIDSNVSRMPAHHDVLYQFIQGRKILNSNRPSMSLYGQYQGLR